MENIELQKQKIKNERIKFNTEVEEWNKYQIKYSNELRQKMNDILSNQNDKNDIIKNSLNKNFTSLKEKIEKGNEIKLEIDNLKYKYDSKLQQLKNLKNNLQKEKLIFEKKMNELRSKIKNERNDIEIMQNEINKKKDEIEKKNFDLDKKEKILLEQKDKNNRIKNFIKEKNNKNLKDEQDLDFAEYKKNMFHNELVQKNNEFENQKDLLEQKIKSLEEDKNEIFNIKNDIEELNKEINLRIRCINDLNANNVINEFNQTMNKLSMQEKKEEIDSLFQNINNNKEIMNNGREQNDGFNSFKKKSFNSELYLLKIKNKIDLNKIKYSHKYNIINEKFNQEKEQEYLMKSYESLNKLKK